MKNFKLKWLLLSIILSIASINTMWGWHGVSLVGQMPAINGNPYYFGTNGSGSTETYAANGNGFKLLIYETYVGYCNKSGEKSSISSDGTGTRVYSDYSGSEDENVTYSGCNGIVCFHYDQMTGDHDYSPWVWITRPTVHLKNTWNTGSWSWKSTTDEGNGYYYVDANFGADGVNWGTNGSSAWQKNSTDVYITASTKYPSSISAGTKVRYRLNTNPSGSSWDAATPTLTIHKILTITYYDNGKTSGTKPGNQEAPHSIASTLATNSGSMAKTGYVFTGWNTQADGKGTHYDAGASITITANTNLYAEWNRKWAVQGSGTEMGAWATYNYLAPTANANEFSGTISLAANTTYVFKLRNREDNSLWGYGDNGNYQLAYIGQSTAHAHNLESTDGKKDLVLMSAKAGTYTFTYNQSTKRLTVGFPSQTHPNTNNIYFKNSGASPYTGVCINIYGGATGGVSGWERMPSMPSCTIDGQTYYYSAIGDNTKCKFANAANSGTNTGEKTGIQSKKGQYYDLATSTWKTFVFDITYKDQGNVAFSGTHNDSPSTHPTSHTFGSSTSLNTASKTGYTFGGWFTNSSCTGSAVTSLTATGYTADITLYAKWTPITYTIRYYSNSASYIGTATDTTAVSSHTYDVAKNLNSNGFNLTGYAFGGWSTTTGTSAATYTDGQSVSNLSSTNGATVNLYARWNIQSYTLTWDLAGGTVSTAGTGAAVAATGSPSSSVTYNSAITAPVVTRAGYTFAGWDVSPVSNMPATNTTYTATWTPKTLTFSAASGNNWNTAANWTDSKIPTIEHDVIIPKTCRVTNKDAKAKSVTIHNYGDEETEGRLYIEYGGGLVVATGISAVHEEEGEEEATTDMDLWIRTDASNNSGLICGDASDNTKATYIFYSKVYRFGSYYVNQYVGTPFTSMSPYQWYGVYVFEYDAAKDAWTNPSDGDLSPFTAYNIISKSFGVTSTTFYTDGTLNLPGTSGTQELNCGSRYSTSETFNDKDHNGDYLFANSWTAPISVAAMDEEDVDGVLQEVHIFNAGFVSKDDSIKEIGENAGQWTAISFGAASYLTHAVIPATQAFCVTATKADAKLTLNYGKHVYNPAIAGGINNDPTRAPRRSSGMNEDPNILRIMVRSDSVMADNMYVFEREDYTYGYDNGWDGTKMMGESFAPQIYGIQGEGKTSIHAIPNMNGTEIGFKAGTQANAYELYFDYNNDEPLYLYDKDTQVFTLIDNETAYSFITSDTEEHARFVLTRSNAPAVATAIENGKSVIRAEKFIEDGQLFILRGDKIYNATGVLVK